VSGLGTSERLGAYGRDWAVYVRDPDGRRVELKLN
jgi:catechol 2,3-dioxygenase